MGNLSFCKLSDRTFKRLNSCESSYDFRRLKCDRFGMYSSSNVVGTFGQPPAPRHDLDACFVHRMMIDEAFRKLRDPRRSTPCPPCPRAADGMGFLLTGSAAGCYYPAPSSGRHIVCLSPTSQFRKIPRAFPGVDRAAPSLCRMGNRAARPATVRVDDNRRAGLDCCRVSETHGCRAVSTIRAERCRCWAVRCLRKIAMGRFFPANRCPGCPESHRSAQQRHQPD